MIREVVQKTGVHDKGATIMRRKILLAAILLFTFFSGVVAAGSIAPNGKYDGFNIVRIFSSNKELKPDKTPGILYKGTTLIPIGLLRSLGVEVLWNDRYQRVDVKLPTRPVAVLTAEQLESLSKYVYKVTVPPSTAHPNGGRASAFMLEDHMVTNSHVGAGASYLDVDIDGTLQRVSTFDFMDESADIMGFTVTGAKSLPYSTELPLVGDPVYCVGFPHGILTVTEGKVYGITVGANDHTTIVHTAKTEPGASGGFLLNGSGKIIGMNESTMVVGDMEYSHVIPIKYLVDQINAQ